MNGKPRKLGELTGAIDRTSIEAAVRLLSGNPVLVVVDLRVLRLLMGDLAPLIVLGPVERFQPSLAEGEQPFAWDEPCR